MAPEAIASPFSVGRDVAINYLVMNAALRRPGSPGPYLAGTGPVVPLTLVPRVRKSEKWAKSTPGSSYLFMPPFLGEPVSEMEEGISSFWGETQRCPAPASPSSPLSGRCSQERDESDAKEVHPALAGDFP